MQIKHDDSLVRGVRSKTIGIATYNQLIPVKRPRATLLIRYMGMNSSMVLLSFNIANGGAAGVEFSMAITSPVASDDRSSPE